MERIDFYLASGSPRRRALLTEWGYQFSVLRPENGEPSVEEVQSCGESALDYVRRLAREKALCGREILRMRGLEELPVLASDTIVVLEGEVLEKPITEERACEFLKRLSGSSHQVYTAVACTDAQGGILEDISISTVYFRKLEDEEIDSYVASGDPLDKAGAYGIQGKAGSFVLSITGSYTGIMGLPITETALLLKKAGIPIFRTAEADRQH